MPGEDTILTREGGRPTVATIEDNTHRYANAVGGVAIGDVVYISANDTVAKADVDAVGTMPPIGVVQSLDGDSACYVVHSGGIATGLSSLTANTQYYLSTAAGDLSTTPDLQGKAFLVGIAINATDLLVCCIPRDFHVIAAAEEPALKFTVGGAEKAKLFINEFNNLKIQNTTSNKHIIFEANDAGVTREALRINAAVPEVVVNEGHSSLVDFRVESDSQTHMLFVDGENNKVGVGTDAPVTTLHVKGDPGQFRVEDTTVDYAYTIDCDGNGIRTHFGDVTLGDGPGHEDGFMSFGSYGALNQLDTSFLDFHIYGTATTTGFYFDVSEGMFGIATSTPSSTLDINGSVATALTTKSSNYTLTAMESTVLLDAGSGSVTITLPAKSGIEGRIYTIKCIAKGGGNAANVATNASEEIDGSSNDLILNAWQSVTLQCTSGGWIKIAEVIPPL